MSKSWLSDKPTGGWSRERALRFISYRTFESPRDRNGRNHEQRVFDQLMEANSSQVGTDTWFSTHLNLQSDARSF